MQLPVAENPSEEFATYSRDILNQYRDQSEDCSGAFGPCAYQNDARNVQSRFTFDAGGTSRKIGRFGRESVTAV